MRPTFSFAFALVSALLLNGANSAFANPWTAPDSTRPAPWGARGPAPVVITPWYAVPNSGSTPVIDPHTGSPIWYDIGPIWDSGGGGGEGGGGGYGDSSASCGGSDPSGATSCSPSSDF